MSERTPTTAHAEPTISSAPEIVHVPAEMRGRTRLGWLESRHSFAFGAWQETRRLRYRTLRVLNDDRVAPGAGFGEHGHRDMEILTWVLSGRLRHGDDLGSAGEIRPGELQVMSAGRGIRHSEMNGSADEPVHFLQIWIHPDRKEYEPRYAQRPFAASERRGRWQRLAAPERAAESGEQAGPLPLRQDARLDVADLDLETTLDAGLDPDRHGYLHVATGSIAARAAADGRDRVLGPGDALEYAGSIDLRITGREPAQVLRFDLA